MNSFREHCVSAWRIGLITPIFLLSYRLGRRLLQEKKNGNLLVLPLYVLSIFVHRSISAAIGCSVPFSCTIGKRINFRHGLYGVFISGEAVIGDDCIIFHQVTIGSNFASTNLGSPTIGSNVLIGAGAKIIGRVSVGDFCKVGVNAVVVDDVPEHQIVVHPKSTYLKLESAFSDNA